MFFSSGGGGFPFGFGGQDDDDGMHSISLLINSRGLYGTSWWSLIKERN